MDMTTAGELLVGGKPERAGHFQVTAMAYQLRHYRDRRGTERDHPRSGPRRGLSGQRAASAQLTTEGGELMARPGVGFQLLLL